MTAKKGENRTGVRARSANFSCGACRMRRRLPPPAVRSTPSWIVTGWSRLCSPLAAVARRARRCRTASIPTTSGPADYKGEFQLGDKRYCYPLTVTDHASRYLLLCEALESTREESAFRAFERLFKERGLPGAIRSDNGVPFASPHGLFQLSKLSVWWLRLGISIPAHSARPSAAERPVDETMHLTLKKEATRPAGAGTRSSSRPNSTPS